MPIIQRQSGGLTENKTLIGWSLSAHPHCGFQLGLLNANEHLEETVSGGGEHSACAVVASFCKLIFESHSATLKDHREKRNEKGGNINSRVAEAVTETVHSMNMMLCT